MALLAGLKRLTSWSLSSRRWAATSRTLSGASVGGNRGDGAPLEGSVVSVSVLDPLLFLEPHRLVQRAEQGPVGGSVGRVDILVTLGLLPVLAAGGKLTLGDMDDPMSFWTFGPPAEVFQLAFCGTHTVVSGWTCLCKTEDLEKAIRGDLVTISWKEFSRLAANEGGQRLINPVARHGGLPLLFAGRVLDCPSASVFKLDRRGAVEGLTIANDFESIDD